MSIYNWNSESEIDNHQIIEMIKSLNIQNDNTSEGIIFRHLLATSTANEIDAPRIPIYVKSPLLDKHWQELKALTPEVYTAAKAYYIFAIAVNKFDGSAKRLTTTVPALRRLKLDALDTGSKQATAIASIWLSMELTLASPIQAIAEIEYSLPYLPTRTGKLTLENSLDSSTAHQWLRTAYEELSVPSKSFIHSMEVIERRTERDEFVTWAFFTAIDALLLQQKYDDALALSNRALNYVSNRNSDQESFLTLFQRLRVLLTGYGIDKKKETFTTIGKLEAIGVSKVELKSEELSYLYQVYKAAAEENNQKLPSAIEKYKKVMRDSLPSMAFKTNHLLRMEHELSRIYDLIGDYKSALEHYKAYRRLLVDKNTEQFKLSNSSFTDGIAKDIELARYRQQELSVLRSEKDGLSTDKEAMKTTIFALIITILTILTLWLWISKRQSDLLAERDSLTGALTRRAMLNSLKKALKGNKASCIALLDVDNFKKINDKYGHVVGDEVLTTFTQIIKNRIRKSDKLCRYGGEEFLIYFSDSDQKSAKRILDELNFALSRQKHWSNTEEKFSVSFSSGLLDVNGETNLDTIIKMCDELLYRAKREGRARVASFPI
ncbi:GGDEF domain-containing protein [Alteromonas macleodii]|uniref:GGDEF domain-containing protein n=1 Tax=Alteromonas macleodii TaxID=28108 RepID=UPI001E3C4282|nr:GGDEF domain-containing protein [Alteromonas macleodii]